MGERSILSKLIRITLALLCCVVLQRAVAQEETVDPLSFYQDQIDTLQNQALEKYNSDVAKAKVAAKNQEEKTAAAERAQLILNTPAPPSNAWENKTNPWDKAENPAMSDGANATTPNQAAVAGNPAASKVPDGNINTSGVTQTTSAMPALSGIGGVIGAPASNANSATTPNIYAPSNQPATTTNIYR